MSRAEAEVRIFTARQCKNIAVTAAGALIPSRLAERFINLCGRHISFKPAQLILVNRIARKAGGLYLLCPLRIKYGGIASVFIYSGTAQIISCIAVIKIQLASVV